MIPIYKAYIPESSLEPLREVFASGSIASGRCGERFRTQFAEYIGNPNTIMTGDISSSIVLALGLAGVGAGDRVIASPMACVATNMPILNISAKVFWCDIDEHSGNISFDSLETAAKSGAKALILPHWGGEVADLEAVSAISKKYGIAVIEDAGEALGAEYDGQRIGSAGSFATVFSFHAIRHITTGEGAAISFADAETAEQAEWLKRYGIHRPSFRDSDGEINPDSDIAVPGLNSYLPETAAAIGIEQMKRVSGVVTRHVENGEFYNARLGGNAGITLLSRPAKAKPSYWVYTFLAERRDDLLNALRGRGVFASKVHYRNDKYSCFGEPPHLPGLDAFCERNLSIPSGWWVTDEDRDAIASAISQGW